MWSDGVQSAGIIWTMLVYIGFLPTEHQASKYTGLGPLGYPQLHARRSPTQVRDIKLQISTMLLQSRSPSTFTANPSNDATAIFSNIVFLTIVQTLEFPKQTVLR